MDILQVNKSNLKKQIGRIYTGVRDYRYCNLVNAYIGGLPIKIETNLSQGQFDLFCKGQLADYILEQI